MQNKKYWLILKAVVIVLFTVTVVLLPTTDNFRKWIRFCMLALFVFSFIKDLIDYQKTDD
jgi:hypothetical protein